MKKIFLILVLFITVTSISYVFFSSKKNTPWDQANTKSTESIDHSLWQNVLDNYLISETENGINLVDYLGLKEDGAQELNAYINRLNTIDPRQYNREEQFAYWVNLYNALTVKLIVKNHPIDSIRKLGKKITTTGPWDDAAITIAGIELSLNDIEHQILRHLWIEPRIHFAVNCASISCPNLQETAFTKANTENLLTKSAKEYINHPRAVSIKNNTLYLSSIFDWYQRDFAKNEKVLIAVLMNYAEPNLKAQLSQFTGGIRYDYDWSLNEES